MLVDVDPAELIAATSIRWSFDRVLPDGDVLPAARSLPVEAPIAVEFNGLGYAVLMATPAILSISPTASRCPSG